MTSEPPDTPDIVVRPTFIFLGGLVISIVAWLLVPDVGLSEELVLAGRIMGVVLMAAWLTLNTWSVRVLQRVGTTPGLSSPATALVQAGPYRFSRNPIYLSIALAYLGVTLLLGNLWGVILLPLWLALVDWGVIRREERYLDERFGEAYRAYRKRVRRWL